VHVTLEPCSHTGRTGPCADALIAAGVACVVGAMEDPDPRVSGRGYAKLEAAGIRVVRNRMQAEARAINAGFILRVSEGRPLFTFKTATTLDGRIATAVGDSQWITGEAARAAGQLMRLQHDAIMVGSNTALADDPELTMRVPGAAPDPKRPRIVVDTRLRLPLGSRLMLSQLTAPLWIVTQIGHASRQKAPYEELGATLIEVTAGTNGGVDIVATAKALAERGLTRVLVEGGGQLAASMLKADLIERIAWFRAPSIVGGDGLPAVAGLGVQAISDLIGFGRLASRACGADSLEMLVRRR
jgi:diaminohydroxyphosphoribosylaminopyrimidine deaminase/5-amino-6-(5-phosphoribosylamino)uracil reductase